MLRKHRILVVEDDMLISLVTEKLLIKLGFQILGRVTDGESAIIQTKKANPDIIIMDICLDGQIDGIEAAKQIWEFSEIPILFASANKDLYDNASLPSLVPHSFTSKPVTKNTLQMGLNKILMMQYSKHRSA